MPYKGDIPPVGRFSKMLSLAKKIYTNLPSSISLPLLHVPFGFFCGPEYRRYLRLEEHAATCSLDERIHICNKLLISYVNESIKNVDYYRTVASELGIDSISNIEQLKLFPVISKEDVQNNIELFTDKRFVRQRYLVSTGGTTGRQLSFYLSNKCYAREWAFVNSFLKSKGINENSRRLCLRGVSGIAENKLIGYNYLYKEILVSPFKLNMATLAQNIHLIKQFKPEFIHGYPSSVTEFAKLIIALGIQINSLKHILLVSEKVYPEQLEIITQAFGCEVITFYGMSERVIFAGKNSDGFYPNLSYGLTEEIDGELVGTGFINEATRLIRYRTGDEATVEKDDFIVTRISDIVGRWGSDALIGKSGISITMTALNTHADVFRDVNRYQFVQYLKGDCELLVQSDALLSNTQLETIQRVFSAKVGDELDIQVRQVKNIELTSRGKHRFIVSHVK